LPRGIIGRVNGQPRRRRSGVRCSGEVRDPEPEGLPVLATDPIPTDEVWYG